MVKELIMKPEYKQLLLLDLCARLPYSPICHIIGENGAEIDDILTTSTIQNLDVWVVKPYLRPMSSMTEEEIIEFNNIPSTKNYTIIENDLPWDVAHYKQIDWLNKKMFDYRGLIPKNLAIEVTEDNNPYKD